MSQFYQKYSLVIFFIIVCLSTICSQNSFSTSNILATAKTQTAIALQEQKIAAVTTTSFRLPFLEKVDFQTETDRFQLQRQEYRVRTTFNGWEEMKSLKQQKEANLSRELAERDVLFKDVLYDRYALLVEYRFAQLERSMYQQIHSVFVDKRDVLQKMAKLSTNFDIEDLIKAEEATFDYHQKIRQSEATTRNINQFLKYSMDMSDSLQLDSANWIPLSILRRLVTELPVSAEKNPNLAQQEASIMLVQSDYNIEKAKSHKIVDYAQIRNSARNRDVLIREWSIGMGITIPYLGSTKTKLNEIALKRLDEENKLKNLQSNLDLQIFNTRQDLDMIFREYDFVQKQVNESQTLYSLDHYANVQGSSPIILLRMKELVLKRQAQLISLEHTAYQKYIKLLDLTGKLAEIPLKNYLSVGLTGF